MKEYQQNTVRLMIVQAEFIVRPSLCM